MNPTSARTNPSEKVRLKFRVSAFEGGAENSEARWTEKWGVSLLGLEEFHVTDHLLKLPFQETPPKTVCIFSVSEGILNFRLLDSDRTSAVNGVPKKEAIIGMGDRIRIGETVSIEVILAPEARVQSQSRKEPAFFSPAPVAPISPVPDYPSIAGSEDGPTLILSLDTLKTTPTSAPQAVPRVAQKSDPMFADLTNVPIDVHEPSFLVPVVAPVSESLTKETVRPELSPGSSGRSAYVHPPEPKVELANVPHAARDESLEDRMAAMTGASFGGVKPFYADKANLNSKQTFAEKILAVVASVLRRDDLGPPAEPFPLDGEIKGWESQPELKARTVTRPIALKGKAVPPLMRPAAFIPQAENPAARLRGRAIVFLLAAAFALTLAVSAFRIWNHSVEEDSQGPAKGFSEWAMPRGVPIEFLEEKVRRMKKR